MKPVPIGSLITIAALLSVSVMTSIPAGATGPDAEFKYTIQPIPEDVLDKMMDRSWEPACPVARDQLAYVELTYWSFDDQPHTGTMVTHEDLASELVEIFRDLFEARFPIEKMQPYEDFDVGEYGAHNDTVGFYCRPAQNDPSVCSSHCYGYAVDINPLINPYLDPTEGWWPEGSDEYANRYEDVKGKITVDSKVVEAFASRGWWWGGLGSRGKDYMHFEKGTFGDETDLTQKPCLVTGIIVREK